MSPAGPLPHATMPARGATRAQASGVTPYRSVFYGGFVPDHLTHSASFPAPQTRRRPMRLSQVFEEFSP